MRVRAEAEPIDVHASVVTESAVGLVIVHESTLRFRLASLLVVIAVVENSTACVNVCECVYIYKYMRLPQTTTTHTHTAHVRTRF
jgi:hypothetical protein